MSPAPATPNVAFYDMPAEAFPFVMEIFEEDTGLLVWRVQVDGASAIPIPGKDPEEPTRMVVITTPDQHSSISFSNGDTLHSLEVAR